MAATASIAQREACSHTPCPIHQLSCGHIVRISDSTGAAECPCLANCAHVVRKVSELESCLQNLNLSSATPNEGTLNATSIMQHAEKTAKFICIPCYRARATLALFPTYHALESQLLDSNPASHVWRLKDRLLVVTEMEEFKKAIRGQIEKLSREVGLRRARGDVWGQSVEGRGTRDGLDVDAWAREFEGKVGVSGVEKADKMMRGLKALGLLSDDVEGK